MINNPNDKPIGERRSGEKRRVKTTPRRKEGRNEAGKATSRRINKERRKD